VGATTSVWRCKRSSLRPLLFGLMTFGWYAAYALERLRRDVVRELETDEAIPRVKMRFPPDDVLFNSLADIIDRLQQPYTGKPMGRRELGLSPALGWLFSPVLDWVIPMSWLQARWDAYCTQKYGKAAKYAPLSRLEVLIVSIWIVIILVLLKFISGS